TPPSSAALIGVFSGSAMLMPSFCWPFDLGPKPLMIRPFAGQRNVTGGCAGAPLTEPVVAGASAGVTTAALCGDSAAATVPGAVGLMSATLAPPLSLADLPAGMMI